MTHQDKFRYTLQFDSLADFARFVAIVRGGDGVNEAQLRELTARLRESTNAVEAAVDAAHKEK